jgi:hypothetical protein
MLGISLFSCLYFKLAKMLFLTYYCCLLFNKIGEGGRTGSAWKRGGEGKREGVGSGGQMAQTMDVHMNKRISNKKRLLLASGFWV